MLAKPTQHKRACRPCRAPCAKDPCVEDFKENAKIFQDLYYKTLGDRDTDRRRRDTYKPATLQWGEWDREYQAAQYELKVICESWDALRQLACAKCCLDIGDLCGDENAERKPPAKPEKKTPSVPSAHTVKPSKNELMADAMDKRADAEADDSVAQEMVKKCEAFAVKYTVEGHVGAEGKLDTKVIPGGEIGASVDIHVSAEKDLKDVCEAFAGQIYRDRARTLRQQAGHLEAMANRDPPSLDYGGVVTPFVEQVAIPPGTADLERVAAVAVESERCASAYLEAYITSYERYQGAQLAGDVAAMVRQAQAMVRFAVLGLEGRRKAARYWYPFESFAREALDRIDALVRSVSEESPSADEATRQAVARRGVKLETTDEIARVTARQNGRPTGPEPEHVGTLLRLWVFARYLLSEAETVRDTQALASQVQSYEDQLRPGLLEALQRRASFTRAHRGPLATVMEGEAEDSSDVAAGWYAADRVWFAWHQDNTIWCASFDPRGDVLQEPRPIGTGRWPRIAAAANRMAISWQAGSGSAVRTCIQDVWSDEVALIGTQASMAFAPNDSLYAATTAGLFRLADTNFTQITTAELSQPSLTFDGAGQAKIAWVRAGHIFCDEADLGEGEQPSLALDANGVLHLAYVTGGAVVVCVRHQGSWSAPQVFQLEDPSWPTLAPAVDGLRLTYLGAAEHGPTALWLLRLPDATPILMPSLAGNVSEAALLVDFDIYSARPGYQPHDVWVSVNDRVVGRLTNTIPEGRYHFPLLPTDVFTSSGRPVPNRIAISSWHMNRGHYVTSTGYQLMVRTAWSEHFAFVSNTGELVDAVKSLGVNHDQPDLAVLANGLYLPFERPESGQIMMQLVVANLGEADSKPARLLMSSEDKFLAQSAVEPLKPGEERRVALPLNADDDLTNIVFHIYQDGEDFDPSNDVMSISLWNRMARPTSAQESLVEPVEDPEQRRDAVIDAINQIAQLVNSVIAEINSVHEMIGAKDYPGAQASLTRARDAFTQTETPFRALGRRQQVVSYKSIYRLAADDREIQTQLIAIAEATVAQAKAGDLEGVNLFVGQHNQLVGVYNRNIDEISKIAQSLN